jgi:hypothetical protein
MGSCQTLVHVCIIQHLLLMGSTSMDFHWTFLMNFMLKGLLIDINKSLERQTYESYVKGLPPFSVVA